MLIANGFQYMMSGRTWISVYPGIALIILIVAINIVGDQLRDQFNPRHAPMSKALLQVRDLRTHFETRAGTIKAVDGISFTLERGEILGLVGESGLRQISHWLFAHWSFGCAGAHRRRFGVV